MTTETKIFKEILTFEIEKETRNTHRYQEISDIDPPVVGAQPQATKKRKKKISIASYLRSRGVSTTFTTVRRFLRREGAYAADTGLDIN